MRQRAACPAPWRRASTSVKEKIERSKDSQLFVPGLLLSVLYCIILPREVRALVLTLQTWKLRPRELNLPRVIELGSGRQVLKLDGVAPEATPVTTG